MGSPSSEKDRSNDETQHKVTLTKGFYIGKYEVTQEQWQKVMENNPSNFENVNMSFGDLPAEQVSWDDCKLFCKKLGSGFRLPTEAEWEYACRGGNKSKGYIYSGSNDIDDVGWYGKNSDNTTAEVGKKKPNELGLYDMSGNVWEWCSDWYGDYSSGAVKDPVGAKSCSSRVSRGGTWCSDAGRCRSAFRLSIAPTCRSRNMGFRLALSIGQ